MIEAFKVVDAKAGAERALFGIQACVRKKL
jgi:hypothetical protein